MNEVPLSANTPDPKEESRNPAREDVSKAGKAALVATLQLLTIVGRSAATTVRVIGTKSTNFVQGLFKGKPMSMQRCSSGHYFDPAKSPECPLCHAPTSSNEPASRDVRAKVAAQQMPSAQQTVGFMVREQGIDPTVGWVVCIAGPERGKDFRIRSERNSIGRNPQMHICINDDSISRDNHASIIFNPVKSTFKLQPGESRGLVYVNGDETLQPVDLKKGDKIKLGSTELLFVPFAGVMYDWK